MGWANCGQDSKGRQIGYAHPATCDHKGCKAKIDRGLGYACGGMHGERDEYCEGYFCEEHVTFRWLPAEQNGQRLCLRCAEGLDEAKLEEYQDVMLDFLRKPAPAKYEFRFPAEGKWVHAGSKADISIQREVWSEGQQVGRVEETIFSDGTRRWDYHSNDDNLNMGLGSGGIAAALERFLRLMDPRPPTTPEHRKAVYELLLRWDDVDKLPVDLDYMTEKQVAYVERRQQNLAEIRKLAHG
jgi:hypothetical protein